MIQLVLISGHLCAGKSGLAKALNMEFGYEIIKTSDLLSSSSKLEKNLQNDYLYKSLETILTCHPKANGYLKLLSKRLIPTLIRKIM